MKNPLENLDWNLLRKEKMTLYKLLSYNNIPEKDLDNIEGLISFIDSIQDFGTDVMGIDENIIFNLKNNEQ